MADRLVFSKTGQHLSSLQCSVITGVWDSKKYSEIAEDNNCSEHHIKKVAAQLWQLFSENLDEKVKKSNFRSTMERYEKSNISKYSGVIHIANINNFCADTISQAEAKQNSSPTINQNNTQPKSQLDLRDAPELTTFYNRTSELATLTQWILQERCRLITILGMSGMGKSALSRQLVEDFKSQFDYIIWRSLRTCPPLNTLLNNLILTLSNSDEVKLPTDTDQLLGILIEKLRDRPSLIILDDVHCIFNPRQLASQYKSEYQDYGILFRLIAELPHNSCLILNSWEPPLEVITLNDANSSVKILQLAGLGESATEILKVRGLLDHEEWQKLITLYQGNPLWLRLVANLINSLFAGQVGQYLSYESVFFGDELSHILQLHDNRLSDLEKRAIAQLSCEPQPISLVQVSEKLLLNPPELFTIILSLERRGWIEKNYQDNPPFFRLSRYSSNI